MNTLSFFCVSRFSCEESVQQYMRTSRTRSRVLFCFFRCFLWFDFLFTNFQLIYVYSLAFKHWAKAQHCMRFHLYWWNEHNKGNKGKKIEWSEQEERWITKTTCICVCCSSSSSSSSWFCACWWHVYGIAKASYC